MTDFIRDNFLILWLLAVIIFFLVGVLLKRKGIKVDGWIIPSDNDAIREMEENMRRDLRENPSMDYIAGNIHYNPEKQDPTRNSVNSILLVFLTVILLSCGGGGGGDSSPGHDTIDHGPLAGTWQGEANNIVFTLYVDGNGQMYTGHIETSNSCYTDTNCAMGTGDVVIELVCYGYSENFYTMLTIDGKYDGDKEITGQIETKYCDNLDHPIVLKKIAGFN